MGTIVAKAGSTVAVVIYRYIDSSLVNLDEKNIDVEISPLTSASLAPSWCLYGRWQWRPSSPSAGRSRPTLSPTWSCNIKISWHRCQLWKQNAHSVSIPPCSCSEHWLNPSNPFWVRRSTTSSIYESGLTRASASTRRNTVIVICIFAPKLPQFRRFPTETGLCGQNELPWQRPMSKQMLTKAMLTQRLILKVDSCKLCIHSHSCLLKLDSEGLTDRHF